MATHSCREGKTMSVGVDRITMMLDGRSSGSRTRSTRRRLAPSPGGVMLLCSITLLLSLTVGDRWLWLTGADRTGVCRAGAHRSPTEPARPGGHQAGRAAPRHAQAGAWSAEASCAGDWAGRDDCRRGRLGSRVSDGDAGPCSGSLIVAARSGVDLRVLCRLPDLRRLDATRCDPSGDLRSMQQRLACAASASTNLASLISISGRRPARRQAC